MAVQRAQLGREVARVPQRNRGVVRAGRKGTAVDESADGRRLRIELWRWGAKVKSPNNSHLLDAVDAAIVGIADGAHLLFCERIEQHDRFIFTGSGQQRPTRNEANDRVNGRERKSERKWLIGKSKKKTSRKYNKDSINAIKVQATDLRAQHTDIAQNDATPPLVRQ